jgi:hypothetical protein
MVTGRKRLRSRAGFAGFSAEKTFLQKFFAARFSAKRLIPLDRCAKIKAQYFQYVKTEAV